MIIETIGDRAKSTRLANVNTLIAIVDSLKFVT